MFLRFSGTPTSHTAVFQKWAELYKRKINIGRHHEQDKLWAAASDTLYS